MAAFVFRLRLEDLTFVSRSAITVASITSPLAGEVAARSAAGEGEAP
jgi:hypothetical protein